MKNIITLGKPNSDFKITETRNEQLERRFLQLNLREAKNIITRFTLNVLQTLKTTISSTSANF